MAKFLHTSLLPSVLLRLSVALVMVAVSMSAGAFPTDFYASNSALSAGKWVKIGVEKSGLYMIPVATLRSWGFNDPAKVRIHGYGGRRIGNVMTQDRYIDDLPAVASEATDAGVVFYAVGPDRWVQSKDGSTRFYGELSPYTLMGYYFVTESDTDAPKVPLAGVPSAGNPHKVAYGRIHHELELMQATQAGPLFVGEDFRGVRSQTFKFSTPGLVMTDSVWMECQFVHRHVGADAYLRFSVDGTALKAVAADKVVATDNSHYRHASYTTCNHLFMPSKKDGFELTIKYEPSRTVNQANLDYLSFNYLRELEMPDAGMMEFWSSRSQLSLGDAAGTARVWDVSDPLNVEQMETGRAEGGRSQWSVSRGGMRNYVAWRPGAELPQPVFVENVANQDLHGYSEPVEMVIFATGEYNRHAERIAELHRRDDSLKVVVIDPVKVYNEFSSGAPDVSGLRKYLKMLYDRGAESGTPLRYAMLMGRPTLDQRAISSDSRTPFSALPWWVVETAGASMHDNDGYGTDDFIAMLADGSGGNLGFDDLLVAVGRMPLTSQSEGNEIVDKLCQYMEKSKKTGWKNHVLVLADNEDNGVHLRQADAMVNNMLASDGQQHVFSKIYIESYVKQNGTYPEARKEMFRELDAGVVWWCFAGHASNHAWTGDGMLTYTDINNMYLRNVPFVLAATCDFLRWDNTEMSGAEIMYKERNGGAIGIISATRPVYISNNAYFLEAFGRNALSRGNDGQRNTAGEIYRLTKNDILNGSGQHVSDSNRLRFVFMGDPAMKLVTPSNIVELTAINGQAVDIDDQITIPALSNVELTGRVVSPDGSLMTDFDGVVFVDLYDAVQSRVSSPTDGSTPEAFDVQGDKLYAGSAKVNGGEFTLNVAMPSLVADNFRPALASMYAYATNSEAEAVGVNREFYIYGFEEPAMPDTVPPEIRSLCLNHAGFKSGDAVNASPMVIAEVADNVGVNLSMSGVGQQLTVIVDDTRFFSDVASFYTPASDGSSSGVINYPLENLTEGAHSLKLRVFDTSGNATSQAIEFFVDNSCPPKIFEVYTDANPASEYANFYIKHDRPDNIVEVGIIVYDLLGHPIWTSTGRGMSDMDISSPVTWNLCDMAGHRVNRGIYLYRAYITTDNAHYETASRRIAVTGR